MPNSKQMLAAALPVPPTADDFVAVPAGGTTKLGTGAVGDYPRHARLRGRHHRHLAGADQGRQRHGDHHAAEQRHARHRHLRHPLNIRAKVTTTPGWKMTTGAGVAVLATGVFT
jgi:hypothetical protein